MRQKARLCASLPRTIGPHSPASHVRAARSAARTSAAFRSSAAPPLSIASDMMLLTRWDGWSEIPPIRQARVRIVPHVARPSVLNSGTSPPASATSGSEPIRIRSRGSLLRQGENNRLSRPTSPDFLARRGCKAGGPPRFSFVVVPARQQGSLIGAPVVGAARYRYRLGSPSTEVLVKT